MKIKAERIWDNGYGIWDKGRGTAAAYILSAIFYILNASAFAAPFASWIDVKAECGAVGDGVADDTAAIQKGLDLIRPEDSQRKILYFPAGQYRITGTIKALREKHRECQGVGLQGVGGEKSVILYDGNGGEPMLQWGAWYSTVRGLGFQTKKVEGGRQEVEGGARPTAGIWFGPEFSTANEVSDCAFQDLPTAIQGGTDKTKGQAEVAVERCVFERCGFGLNLANWNSLDWWFWDCRFTDCETGVSNRPGCGEFRLYQSQFQGSKKTDVEVGNLGTFALVENVSRGSRLFFSASWGQTAGGNFTFQRNRVEGTTFDGKIADQATPGLGIYMGNPGPVLMLDNQFAHREGAAGPDIFFQSANKGNPIGAALLIGNTTTGSVLYEKEKDYEIRILDKGYGISEGEKLKTASNAISNIPYSISPPQVIEVAAGSGGEDIQKAVDGAMVGQVIHLPAGNYNLSRPLVIRAGQDLQIVGDGILNSTALVPQGDFGVRGLIEVEAGGQVELRDLALQASTVGGGAVGLLVKVVDTNAVVVCGDQVQTTGFGPGLVVEGLDDGRVVLRNHGHNGLTVFGGPKAQSGQRVSGQVELLCGASSRVAHLKAETPIYDVRQGGRIMVRDVWYEGHVNEFLDLQDQGDFLYCGGIIAPYQDNKSGPNDAIKIEGKSGRVMISQAALNAADLTIGKLVKGFVVTLFGVTPYPGTRISCGDPSYGELERVNTTNHPISNIPDPVSSKPAEAGFVQLMCRQNNTKITGSEPLPDVNAQGDVSERFRMLRDWKLPDPSLDAPIKLHRVSCTGSIGMVVVSAQPKAKGKE